MQDITEKQDRKNFGAPFNDADADIILRSADQVDFRVYKIILAKASSIFADMFSLPQQADCDSDVAEAHTNIPIIHVTEDATTISHLLTLCYPFEDPSLTALEEIALLLAASQKYELARVRTVARLLFYNSPEFAAQPMKAFRLAWKYHLAPETREAAKKTLEGPMTIESLGQELKYMEGEAVYELFDYRTRSKGILKKIWTSGDDESGQRLQLITRAEISQCFPSTSFCSACRRTIVVSSFEAYCHRSLVPYIEAALEALRSRLTGTSMMITAGETAAIILARDVHCKNCTSHSEAAKALAKFSQLLASKVDDYISSVSIARLLAQICRSLVLIIHRFH
jgi:BTB/POZ domain